MCNLILSQGLAVSGIQCSKQGLRPPVCCQTRQASRPGRSGGLLALFNTPLIEPTYSSLVIICHIGIFL